MVATKYIDNIPNLLEDRFTQHHPDDADRCQRSVSFLLRQVMYSRATDMARKGRYREARSLLDDVDSMCGQSTMSLDLRARIEVQEGRFHEAEGLWRQALEMEPGNDVYIAALRRIDLIRRPLWVRSTPSIAMVIVIIAIAVVGAVFVTGSNKKGKTGVLDSRHASTPIRLPSPLNIDVNGIYAKPEGNNTILIFDSGLFSRNTRLTQDGKALLTTLARQLESYVGKVSITVTGVTDDIPMPEQSRYVDNGALGMARALKVVDHMRSTSRLPADMFSIEGKVRDAAPYANDSPVNRLRNRTVVMRILNRQ